ncbi:MAG: dihydropteroate synthase [Acidobacteria bacterium]|nr:dihydropteroate synthase [Acidobacteriota bacterium]MCI0624569.1 dihydropteroate synthase [Acidobacteriota bacterium]MCI0717579.1 dihydropteroate synthase [Acidobacteriota bacterium]
MQARKRYEVELPSRRLVLGGKTLIMGVLNVTPDSFFKESRRRRFRDAVSRGLQLEEEGADILDIGGESTRPPFLHVLPPTEEIRRIVPVIEALRKRLSIPISVDTFKAQVAHAAISAGAEIVNDVGGLRLDRKMPEVVASEKAALVVMHSRGKPEQMHHLPRVRNVLKVVLESLERSIRRAVSAGIGREQIIVDPGIGFSKTAEDNLILLKNLAVLSRLRLPILVGASRKSFLGKILNVPVEQRLLGSLACCAMAVLEGAHIVRVHDVKESRQVVALCDAVREA